MNKDKLKWDHGNKLLYYVQDNGSPLGPYRVYFDIDYVDAKGFKDDYFGVKEEVKNEENIQD